MLTVRTYVGSSKIHGLGLFAAEPIRKGQLVWKFVPGIDVWMPGQTVRKQPEAFQEFMRTYAFKEVGQDIFIMSLDNDRFQNHSSNPNIVEDVTDVTSSVTKAMIAARDISAGEEILSNYRQWDECSTQKEIPE